MNPQFKFLSLKVFGSTEFLYHNVKKYRKVYDEKECRYLYAELALYNKLFDENVWTANVKLLCYNTVTNELVCELKKDLEVSTDTNILYVREGWGTPEPGWWKKGSYKWMAYVGGQFLGETFFYVTDRGVVTKGNNPCFSIKQVRLFESPRNGMPIAERTYLKKFGSAITKYINIEMGLDFIPGEEDFPLELQFNFYNDSSQHKAYMEYFTMVAAKTAFITIDTGYGSDTGGYWFEDKYNLEVVFMDTLVAVVPFEVATEAELMDTEYSDFFDTKINDDDIDFEDSEEKPIGNAKATFEEATEELNKLIGLQAVKKEVQEFATYLQFLKLRKEKGFDDKQRFNLNIVFTGNPGTGKTTVARMLGKIYHSLDLLSTGEVHEVGRVDLVGEYIGQTAPKVKKVIDKARGGILFIDEAYSLTDRGDDGKDFGREVIEILLKEMSDGPGNLAIIFAGYPKEMHNFTNSNPGLASRIGRIIHFPDYTPEDLMAIVKYSSEKSDIIFSQEASDLLYKKIVEEYRNRDQHFGNARFVNAIVEQSKQNMAIRLMKNSASDLDALDRATMSTINVEDVEVAFGMDEVKGVVMPIDDALLQDSLSQLNDMVGLEGVKKDVSEMVKLVRYYKEIGKDVKNAFSIHTVFTGNAGTGKTTVARLLVRIYKALGILERGHLVETDRKGLVAGFVGQTAIKTADMIDKAMGGGLFIDEAYALTSGGETDFGREAIEALLKRMEDSRGQFMVIVAGYPKEMRKFLEANPGLMSRFDKQLNFSDYSSEEMLRIADMMFDVEGLFMEDNARNVLSDYIQKLSENKHQYFGNARTIRKIVGEAVRKQHLRLASISPAARTPAMIKTVIVDDVSEFNLIEQAEDPRKGIGFKR